MDLHAQLTDRADDLQALRRGYLDAIARVTLGGEGTEHVHVVAPTCQDSTDTHGTIVDVDGSELTTVEARARAFELLVLADVADTRLLDRLTGR